jgi:hypothetical protein
MLRATRMLGPAVQQACRFSSTRQSVLVMASASDCKCCSRQQATNAADSGPQHVPAPIAIADYRATFYKRALPNPPCIDFSSDEGVQQCPFIEVIPWDCLSDVLQPCVQHGASIAVCKKLSIQHSSSWCGIERRCSVHFGPEC